MPETAPRTDTTPASGPLGRLLLRGGPFMAFGGSAALLFGAYMFQHVGGLEPCPLCLLQRYPHFAVLGVALAAALVSGWPRTALLACAGLACLVSTGYAVFHVGVEEGWFASACATGVSGASVDDVRASLMAAPTTRCDEIPWSLIGVSMAGWNALISFGLAMVCFLSALAALRSSR